MSGSWVSVGLKLRHEKLEALRQVARARSVKGGREVTVLDLIRPLVDEFLAANKQEVDEALSLLEKGGGR
jgi:hypothetical protein